MNELGRGGNLPVRRILAVHDLSCFGRCALTVILPTLCAMGNQVVPLPTALLSSHTGGFDDLTFRDLTEDMHGIVEHFKRLHLKFDSIYTGFLGDIEQIRLVQELCRDFVDEDTLLLVDPVMGDNGTLYSTYTPALCDGMHKLCQGADIITPNLTEACILTNTTYKNTEHFSAEEAFAYADQLRQHMAHLNNRGVVITGIAHSQNKFATYGYHRDFAPDGFLYSPERIRRSFPGTGDLFASVLLGSLLRKIPFEQAVHHASDFTSRVMAYSAQFDTPARDGVAFEHFLRELSVEEK